MGADDMTIKPSLEEVKNIAKAYNTIPLSCELPMNYTPVGIIKKIRAVYVLFFVARH